MTEVSDGSIREVGRIARLAGINSSGTFERRDSDVGAAVLTHLASEGDLVPADGLALTAEQVLDLRNVLDHGHPMSAQRLLDALFPATEPAEEVEEWSAIEDVPVGLIVKGQAMIWKWDGTHPYRRNGGGWTRESCDYANRWWPFTPAPAEPAEEETKAERCPSEIEGWGCSLTSGHDGDHTAHDQDGPAYVWPVSSPVVPAPTETGPWQTWQEVPEGVQYYGINGRGPTYYVNRDGVRHRVFDDTPSKTADYIVQNFAPFVAAEGGRA